MYVCNHYDTVPSSPTVANTCAQWGALAALPFCCPELPTTQPAAQVCWLSHRNHLPMLFADPTKRSAGDQSPAIRQSPDGLAQGLSTAALPIRPSVAGASNMAGACRQCRFAPSRTSNVGPTEQSMARTVTALQRIFQPLRAAPSVQCTGTAVHSQPLSTPASPAPPFSVSDTGCVWRFGVENKDALMRYCGVHCLLFPFVCFLISLPPPRLLFSCAHAWGRFAGWLDCWMAGWLAPWRTRLLLGPMAAPD